MRATQIDFLLAGVTDSNGAVLNGGKVYFYEVGTTTPKTIWTDQDKTSEAANPYTLDTLGRAELHGQGAYKIVIKTSAEADVKTYNEVWYGMEADTALYGGTSTGSSNAYAVTLTPSLPSLETGLCLSFLANHENNGASTLAVNGLTATAIRNTYGAALTGGEIKNGALVQVVYEGTYFRLTSVTTSSDYVATVGGTANAITLTPSPAITAYTTGARYTFIPASNNTAGSVTVAISGLSTKAIKVVGQSSLRNPLAGELDTDTPADIIYDGTQFVLLNPVFYARELIGDGTVRTFSDTTSEQTLVTGTIPAGAMQTSRALHVLVFGRSSNSDGAEDDTLTIKLKFDSTVLLTADMTVTHGSTNNDWILEAWIINDGLANDQDINGTLHYENSSSDSTAGTMRTSTVLHGRNVAAVDTSADVTLTVTGQLDPKADPDISFSHDWTRVTLL